MTRILWSLLLVVMFGAISRPCAAADKVNFKTPVENDVRASQY